MTGPECSIVVDTSDAIMYSNFCVECMKTGKTNRAVIVHKGNSLCEQHFQEKIKRNDSPKVKAGGWIPPFPKNEKETTK